LAHESRAARSGRAKLAAAVVSAREAAQPAAHAVCQRSARPGSAGLRRPTFCNKQLEKAGVELRGLARCQKTNMLEVADRHLFVSIVL
jgi:hypothetical protein